MPTYSVIENEDTGFHELSPALDDGGLGTLLGNFSLLGTAAQADAATLVPYSGATQDADLGSCGIVCGGVTTIGSAAQRPFLMESSETTDAVCFVVRDSGSTGHDGVEGWWMANLDESFTPQTTSFDSVCVVVSDNENGSGLFQIKFIRAGDEQGAWVTPSPLTVLPDYVTVSQLRLAALNTAPSSASATGTLGEIGITDSYIYVCVAANTWRRGALATW